MKNGHPHVFLSYSRQDKPFAVAVVAALRERGAETWFDDTDLAPGVNWEEELFAAMDSADVFAYFASKHTSNSKWSQLELGAAISAARGGHLQLVPILVPGATASDLPFPLKRMEPISEPTPELVADRIQEALAGTPVAAA